MRSSLATATICALALGLAACPHPTPRVPDAGSPSNDGGPPPAPLGAHGSAAGDSITFAVRSAAATRIEIELFAQPIGSASVLSIPLQQSGEVWSATVKTHDLQSAGISGTVYYGYRAWGPNWNFDPSWAPGSNAGFVADVDDQGNRFNPNKLLVDPYARELSHDPFQPMMPDPSVYGVGSNDRDKDSAPSAPKGIVLPEAPLDSGVRPAWPLRDDVIYEVHLRGLTENYPDAGCPGTYAAAATQAGYLSALGITAVEFLPVQETQNDTNTDTAPGNYWGYSTLGFFSPDRHYACDKTPGGPTREFAAMVAAFHAQGIKVFLDVVYNHTAETGSSSLFSFRGLDNARYYELDATGHGNADFTGLGGTVNTSTPIVRDLVMDSLHYWVGSLGVDGFRFDLGAILGNACSSVCFQFAATDPANVLNRSVAELPGVALIAEPWGIGNGTYEVGSFPPGWSTWNDQNRDRLKRSQNALGAGSPDPGGIATSVAGSSDIYGTGGRGPWASINYVVSHDGFTLHDQYTCSAPDDSQPFPYGPSSGGSNNDIPWDQGGDPALQAQAARNGFALILTEAGVPMFTGGDEFGRTIRCNNNSYNLDSIGTWIDWSLLPANQTLQTFAARAIAFRRAHPALRPSAYWSGTDHNGNGLKDVTWYDPSGAEASGAYFSDANANFLAWRVDGTEAGDTARSIYVAYNQGTTAVSATLPAAGSGFHWYQLGDTSAAMAGAGYFAASGTELVWSPATYLVAPRSVAVLVERP